MPLPSDKKPQGEFLGMPYDFRAPNRRKFFARIWNPGGPLFSPKVWGMGWTLNLAHPWAWPILGSIFVFVALVLSLC